MNILITGGAGFIGSNLSNALAKSNKHNVAILDNLEPQIHGDNPEKSYTYKSLNKNITIHNADLKEKSRLDSILDNQDIIVHLAAQTGTGQSMYQAKKYFDVNVTGTINLFESIRKKDIGLKKFILSSSRSIYGEGKYFCEYHGFVYPETRHHQHMTKKEFECKCPICENPVKSMGTDESSKINPSSFYALTKEMQEDIVKYYCNFLEIPYIIFRMQNVYGEGQSLNNPYTGIISIFTSLLSENRNVEIFEDGKESRDFIYVKDVVRAYILAIENEKIFNKIINLGTGKRTSVLKLALLIKKLLNSKSEIHITELFRLGDIRHSYADITKAKNYLNYKPAYPLSKGLKLFIEWAKMEHHEHINYEESLNLLKKKSLLIQPKS